MSDSREQLKRAAPPVIQRLDLADVNAALAMLVKRQASLEERVLELEREIERLISDGK